MPKRIKLPLLKKNNFYILLIKLHLFYISTLCMGCHSYCQGLPVIYFERELKIEFKLILLLAITGLSQQYLILTSDPSTLLSPHRGLTHQTPQQSTAMCRCNLVDQGAKYSVSCPYLLRWGQINMLLLCVTISIGPLLPLLNRGNRYFVVPVSSPLTAVRMRIPPCSPSLLSHSCQCSMAFVFRVPG